jgi:hypothetical protein
MKALDDYLDSIGATYRVRFVPQSKSRNRNKPEPSINWRYTFKSVTGAMTGDFQQGIGHAPLYNTVRGSTPGHTIDLQRAIARRAAERGRAFVSVKEVERETYGESIGATRALSAPEAASVLNCLVLDSSAKDYSFVEWCREYGYDDDSRGAERIYNACVKTARELDCVFTSEQLAHLRGLLEGY